MPDRRRSWSPPSSAPALFLLSIVAADIYTLMVNFTAGGFYLAFLFPLVGFLVVQLRGAWTPGPFTLGRLALPVGGGGRVWAVLRVPQHLLAAGRLPSSASSTGRCWIVVAVLGVVGVAVFASVRSRILDARLIEDDERQDELSDLAGGPRRGESTGPSRSSPAAPAASARPSSRR